MTSKTLVPHDEAGCVPNCEFVVNQDVCNYSNFMRLTLIKSANQRVPISIIIYYQHPKLIETHISTCLMRRTCGAIHEFNIWSLRQNVDYLNLSEKALLNSNIIPQPFHVCLMHFRINCLFVGNYDGTFSSMKFLKRQKYN